jgi:hypothetical protein
VIRLAQYGIMRMTSSFPQRGRQPKECTLDSPLFGVFKVNILKEDIVIGGYPERWGRRYQVLESSGSGYSFLRGFHESKKILSCPFRLLESGAGKKAGRPDRGTS